MNDIIIQVNPKITREQLFNFYVRNYICEVGFGKDIATKVLYNSSIIVGAFQGEELIGFSRAMFDGLSAVIMEFCLEIRLQGEEWKYSNGFLIEKDDFGIGNKMGKLLLNELDKMGATFFSLYIVEDCEEAFFELLGFREHKGHKSYIIDKRPYIKWK